MCTAIREAVNVWPLEYVLSRYLGKAPAGVLVMSEFTGFARVLNGGLRVNPFAQAAMVENLDTALQMAGAEREARAEKDLKHIENNNMETWARRFLEDLKSVARKGDEEFVSVGFGLSSFRMIGMGEGFKQLDTQEAVASYNQSTNRAFLLDWGGTLTTADSGIYDARDADDHTLPASVVSALTALCADPANHVMILSGLGRDKVEQAFGGIPNLSLAVEHGFYYTVKGGKWRELQPGVDTSWKQVAASVMKGYAARTHGAYVTTKGCSVLWNFQQSDPDFGVMQAKEVQVTLADVLKHFPVVVRTGKGYVEACHNHVNKGAMAERFVSLCSQKKPLGFVLCAGDDSTDELMFASLHAKYAKVRMPVDEPRLARRTAQRAHPANPPPPGVAGGEGPRALHGDRGPQALRGQIVPDGQQRSGRAALDARELGLSPRVRRLQLMTRMARILCCGSPVLSAVLCGAMMSGVCTPGGRGARGGVWTVRCAAGMCRSDMWRLAPVAAVPGPSGLWTEWPNARYIRQYAHIIFGNIACSDAGRARINNFHQDYMIIITRGRPGMAGRHACAEQRMLKSLES